MVKMDPKGLSMISVSAEFNPNRLYYSLAIPHVVLWIAIRIAELQGSLGRSYDGGRKYIEV